ncbi:hypothetical protein LguiA_005003 [Lonicera macranthoides]
MEPQQTRGHRAQLSKQGEAKRDFEGVLYGGRDLSQNISITENDFRVCEAAQRDTDRRPKHSHSYKRTPLQSYALQLYHLQLTEKFNKRNSSNFQGDIPASLERCQNMLVLDLSQNNLSAKISQQVMHISTLTYLDVSHNCLTGPIPKEVRELMQLEVLDVSENNLSSKIPSSLVRRRVTSPSILRENSHVRVSYQSLLKATDGFSLTNLIGAGSFGHVYKGFLPELGEKLVAVKVFNPFHSRGSKSFITECEALKSIRHQNLVKVLTACSSVDHNGNEFKAIVYEFMANISLDKRLHPNIPTEEDLEETHEVYSRKLTLGERLNIAIDVACAVNYLHCDCEAQIIHCDLKPSNVLLDNEITGHLGDLGLARLLPQRPESFPTNQTSSLGIKEISKVSEVKCQHMVICIASASSYWRCSREGDPVMTCLKTVLTFCEFSKMALSKPLIKIIDPILLQQEEARETSTSNANTTHNHSHIGQYSVQECLISILRIGIACSEESPRERLEISDVLAKLHIIRATILRAR